MRNTGVLVLLWVGLWLVQGPSQLQAQVVPRDNIGIPIYGGLGLPVFSEAVTLTTTSFTSLMTVPTETAQGYKRQFRHFELRNPSSTRSVYICFSGASPCSTSQLKIPPNYTYVLDHQYFGPFNSITTIYGKLDSAGSVTPEVTIW